MQQFMQMSVHSPTSILLCAINQEESEMGGFAAEPRAADGSARCDIEKAPDVAQASLQAESGR